MIGKLHFFRCFDVFVYHFSHFYIEIQGCRDYVSIVKLPVV